MLLLKYIDHKRLIYNNVLRKYRKLYLIVVMFLNKESIKYLQRLKKLKKWGYKVKEKNHKLKVEELTPKIYIEIETIKKQYLYHYFYTYFIDE